VLLKKIDFLWKAARRHYHPRREFRSRGIVQNTRICITRHRILNSKILAANFSASQAVLDINPEHLNETRGVLRRQCIEVRRRAPSAAREKFTKFHLVMRWR
jgi:hypothetical protein